jgi:hypothetical protein
MSLGFWLVAQGSNLRLGVVRRQDLLRAKNRSKT